MKLHTKSKKTSADKLSKSVAFRLTEADFVKYKNKFSASGLSQSKFFRQHVLNNTTRVVSKSLTASRAVLLLSKASNNLNQLAHRANLENKVGKLSDETFGSPSYPL